MTTGEKIAVDGECTITFTVEWVKEYAADVAADARKVDFSLQLDYEQDTTPFDGAESHS